MAEGRRRSRTAQRDGATGGAVTIVDVARQARVSVQTVSRVLNNKGEISEATRRAVLEVIERLGYRPSGIARSLVTSRTLTLGLIVPDIANPFFPEIARGVEDVAADEGYGVVLCNTVERAEREEAALQLLADKRVDGIIVCSARLGADQLYPLLQQCKAAVLVNRSAPADVAGTICVDDATGTRQAVTHLLETGRRTIGFLSGPPNSHSGQARMRGAASAQADAGVTLDPALTAPSSPYLEGGKRACRDLLSARPDVEAVACYNDLVAVGALLACRELGVRVPDDVAITGNDDIPLAELVTPPLTTLRVPKYEIGVAAVRMLFGRIRGVRGTDAAVVRPELIVRESAP